MTIGEKVKLYRDTHGESQRQFAIRAGVSNTTINYLEKGVNPNTGKAFAPDTETISLYIFVKIKDRPSLDGHNAKLGSHHPESDRLPISLFDEI